MIFRPSFHSVTLGFALACVLSVSAHAEKESGDAVQIVREVDLRKEPSKAAPSMGRLPKGTIATYLGDEKGGFVLVGVELQKGNIEGWVPLSALDQTAEKAVAAGGKAAASAEAEREEKVEEEERTQRPSRSLKPRTKLVIPQDEGALLHREETFFYGLYGSGNYTLMQDAFTDYSGIGFSGGAFGGMYLMKGVPVRLELGYTLANGTGTNNINLQFGLLDAAIEGGYQIERFEIFGGAQYSYGISLSNLPPQVVVGGASDLSNFYALVGAGYRIPFSDVGSIAFRGRYSVSLLQRPVVFQFFGLYAYLEFNG